MPNLKDLKNRIDSVKSTRKITKAMKMVAASKLRRAEEAAQAARPYAERMEGMLSNIATTAKNSEEAPALLGGTGDDKRVLLIVCTSDRGLCGGFNTSIVKRAKAEIAELRRSGKDFMIQTVGKKGRELLKREFSDVMMDPIIFENVKRVGYAQADEVGEAVLGAFEEGKFDVAKVFYAEFESAMTQHPSDMQLIPAMVSAKGDGDEGGKDVDRKYDYEPEEGMFLDDLLPKNVKTQIFRALLENSASEHGARMTAMDNASRNADDMIDKLELQYNRQRQAAITNELIEIISGAEAL